MRTDETIVRKPAALFAIENIASKEVIEIQGALTIGRKEGCDIELLQGHVSRKHATIEAKGAELTLKDEGSANGTYVNDERISTTVLKAGDHLRFDIHEFIVIALVEEDPRDSATQVRPLAAEEVAAIKASSVEPVTDPVPEPIADPIPEPIAKPVAHPVPEAKIDTPQASEERTQVWTASSQTGDGTVVLGGAALVNETPTGAAVANESKVSLYGYHPILAGKVFSLDQSRLKIGKSPLVDIVIQDGSVSSNHAEIKWENNQWVLHDLNSTNGTFVNGEQIYKPTVLQAGDLLLFGLIELVFAQPEPASATKTSSSRWKWIVAALALVLVVIAAGACWQFFTGKDSGAGLDYQASIWQGKLPQESLYRIDQYSEMNSLLISSLQNVYDVNPANGIIQHQLSVVDGICAAQKINNQYVVIDAKGQLKLYQSSSNVPTIKSIVENKPVGLCHINALKLGATSQLLITIDNTKALYDMQSQQLIWQENIANTDLVLSSDTLLKGDYVGVVTTNLQGVVTASRAINNQMQQVWSQQLDNTNYHTVQLSNGILVYSDEGDVRLLNLASGQQIWRLNKHGAVASVLANENEAFISTVSGKLLKISMQDASLLAEENLHAAAQLIALDDDAQLLTVITANGVMVNYDFSLRLKSEKTMMKVVDSAYFQARWVAIAENGQMLGLN